MIEFLFTDRKPTTTRIDYDDKWLEKPNRCITLNKCNSLDNSPHRVFSFNRNKLFFSGQNYFIDQAGKEEFAVKLSSMRI